MTAKEIRAAGLTDPHLSVVYAACDAFLRKRNSAAYPAARLLLAPDKRPYWDAILAFSTYVDDLIDDPEWPVAERTARAEAYERNVFSLMAGDDPWADGTASGQSRTGRHLAHAFSHFVRTWNIPADSVRTFMTTIRTDLEVAQYPSFTDLERYIHGVCVQGVLWGNALLMPGGRREPEAERKAAAASFGLQLTDYLRDLAEDLGDGRLYLPLEDLTAFGLSRDEVDWAAQRARMTPKLRELVRFEVERADRYFTEAADWWRLVDPPARELPRQYVRLGRFSLERIIRSDYDLFRTPPRAHVVCGASSGASFSLGLTLVTAQRLATALRPRDACRPLPDAQP
ncbi:squalene/phytoene synthase family protein [Streptomyces lancefieldiae]|uniref:Squalene/phytoene synthase family protein n=1 Tax=Streptomyces lancefieldiae TaxID=3075520 RepID=A0ABU3ANQ6_9ACTN|nr:squalene/phytoene synthase family protein [Streptomyces sp. DSM 40712]MDT0611828.1 squalene/phytoene synthase family protein [Streptomyces sp. DSM 40712]